MSGSQVVSKRAMDLASDPIYCSLKNSEVDQQKREQMRNEKFDAAWKEFLSALAAGELVEQIKEIHWRSITKLFRGCCETLPQLSIKQRKWLETSFNQAE